MKSSMGHSDIEGETHIYSVCVCGCVDVCFQNVTPDGNSGRQNSFNYLLSVLVEQILVYSPRDDCQCPAEGSQTQEGVTVLSMNWNPWVFAMCLPCVCACVQVNPRSWGRSRSLWRRRLRLRVSTWSLRFFSVATSPTSSRAQTICLVMP